MRTIVTKAAEHIKSDSFVEEISSLLSNPEGDDFLHVSLISDIHGSTRDLLLLAAKKSQEKLIILCDSTPDLHHAFTEAKKILQSLGETTACLVFNNYWMVIGESDEFDSIKDKFIEGNSDTLGMRVKCFFDPHIDSRSTILNAMALANLTNKNVFVSASRAWAQTNVHPGMSYGDVILSAYTELASPRPTKETQIEKPKPTLSLENSFIVSNVERYHEHAFALIEIISNLDFDDLHEALRTQHIAIKRSELFQLADGRYQIALSLEDDRDVVSHYARLDSDQQAPPIDDAITINTELAQKFLKRFIEVTLEEYYFRVDRHLPKDIRWIVHRFFSPDALYKRGEDSMSGAEELDRFYGTERKIVGAHTLYCIKVEDVDATAEGRFLGVDSAEHPVDKEFIDRMKFNSKCLVNFRQTFLAAGAASVRG